MIALVLEVIAFSISTGSILKVFGSTSTNTGVKLRSPITSTVAAKVKSAVIISSPGFNPRPINAICKASVPFAQGITFLTPRYFSRSD